MFRFLQHPLWEPQFVQIWIEMIDGEGVHPDRPILIEDPDPILILNYISRENQRHGEDPFFIRFSDQTYGRRSFQYMTRHFPKLVFDYFESSEQPTSIYWEDWEIVESVSWKMNPQLLKTSQLRYIDRGIVCFGLVESAFGRRYWVPWYMMLTQFPTFILELFPRSFEENV